MLRTIIVDDESMICELILRLVDWKALGIEVIGSAHDGESALALAKREKPDIIITDIRIPELDGLELISRVQSFAPQTRFIVISGYRHFEYAHSALRYGVKYYLLKPINADELRHALESLRADIELERNERTARAQMTEQLSATGARMRQQFLTDLIENRLTARNLSAAALNRDYGFSLREEPVQLFIVKISCLQNEGYDLMPLVFSSTAPIVRSVLQPICSTFELLPLGSRMYCLFQPAEGMSANTAQLFQKIADQFDDVLNAFEDFNLTLCPAAPAQTPGGLPTALADAEHAVHLRLIAVRARVVDREAAAFCRTLNIDALFSRSQQAVFSQLLDSGDRDMVRDGLQQIFAPIRQLGSEQYDPEVLFTLCRQLIQLVRTAPACGRAALDFTPVERAIDNASSVFGLLDSFSQAFLDALEPYFVLAAEKTGAPVQRAISYIEAHYAEPLTLNSVAMQTNLSPAYLSTLFKKETGSSFSEYLTLCRMNAAKQLLRQTDEPVSLIAERTGYLDAKYFSKVFAKTFGISPQKYRNL